MGRTAALTVAKDSNAIDNADTNMVKLFSWSLTEDEVGYNIAKGQKPKDASIFSWTQQQQQLFGKRQTRNISQDFYFIIGVSY